MTKEEPGSGKAAMCSGSGRAQSHADMLKAAQDRPGVREVMQVYRNWQVKDGRLGAHHSATKTPERTETTNRTNIS